VGPCAGAGGEWIVAHGFGALHTGDATGQMVVLSLGGRAAFPVASWLTLRLVAEGLVPLAHPTFVIDNAGTVYHAPVALFRASAGAELHF
jgi:hypothetical protein